MLTFFFVQEPRTLPVEYDGASPSLKVSPGLGAMSGALILVSKLLTATEFVK